MNRTRTIIGGWIGLSLAIAGCLLADTIVLKEKDSKGNPKRIVGRQVGEQGTGPAAAIIVESAGQRGPILKSKIERIEPSVPEDRLEQLDPRSPQAYFDLGAELAQTEDPDARSVARHLLSAAVEMDPGRFRIPAARVLAETAQGDERGMCLAEVLRLEPDSEWARQELEQLWTERNRESAEEFQPLVQAVRTALTAGQVAPLVAFAKSADARPVFDKLAGAMPNLPQQLRAVPVQQQNCAACKGTTQTKCLNCKRGRIPCAECNGNGKLRSSVTQIITDPFTGIKNTMTTQVSQRCLTCQGRKTFPCNQCQSGMVPCEACKGKQPTSPLPTAVREQLDQLWAVLQARPSDSWACALIIEDRAPFRGLNAPRAANSVEPVQGRYYRRGGVWRDKP